PASRVPSYGPGSTQVNPPPPPPARPAPAAVVTPSRVSRSAGTTRLLLHRQAVTGSRPGRSPRPVAHSSVGQGAGPGITSGKIRVSTNSASAAGGSYATP